MALSVLTLRNLINNTYLVRCRCIDSFTVYENSVLTHSTIYDKIGYDEQIIERGKNMTNTMDNLSEHFYISPELSEIIDLVFEREKLIKSYKLTGCTNYVQSSEALMLTARLETLIKKDED